MKQLSLIFSILCISICNSQSNTWSLGVNISSSLSFNVLEEFNFSPTLTYSNNKNFLSLGYKTYTQDKTINKKMGLETFYKRYVTPDSSAFRLYFLIFCEYINTIDDWDNSYYEYDDLTGEISQINVEQRIQKNNYFNADIGYGFDLYFTSNIYFNTGVGIGLFKFYRNEKNTLYQGTSSPIVTFDRFWSSYNVSVLLNAGIGYKFNKLKK